jgi:hypothetical protein
VVPNYDFLVHSKNIIFIFIFIEPNFNLFKQINALFKRKLYNTIRSYQEIVMFFLPLMFTLLSLFINIQSDIQQDVINFPR